MKRQYLIPFVMFTPRTEVSNPGPVTYKSSRFRYKTSLSFELDLKFWHFVPSINLNLHSKSIEFEFLCFGIYLDFYVK